MRVPSASADLTTCTGPRDEMEINLKVLSLHYDFVKRARSAPRDGLLLCQMTHSQRKAPRSNGAEPGFL